MEELKIWRISPLAGPIDGSTRVNIFGNGFNSSVPIESSVFVKFGTIEAQEVVKANVYDISWDEEAYHNELSLNKFFL